MKLYSTPQGHWTGTQADAKKLAKEHNTSCDIAEVPVDKKGLLAFLNERRVKTCEVDATESNAGDLGEKVTAVAEVEVERKIIGEPREQYMRTWRQEQADLDAEFKVRTAIEDVLLEAPLDDLAQYTSVLISRLGEVIDRGPVTNP